MSYAGVKNQAARTAFPHWQDWTPTAGGFSVAPAGSHRYLLEGHKCTLIVRENSGTSNATTFTLSLPPGITAAKVTSCAPAQLVNAGSVVAAAGLVEVSGTTITLYTSTGGAGWTNSGTKYARFTLIFEV